MDNSDVCRCTEDDSGMARVLFIMTIGFLLWSTGVHSSQVQGVVNSSVTVPCHIPNGLDVESVGWVLNGTALPFLSYIPKDDFISPADHDRRFSIMDPSKLDISHLMKSDSGEYMCIVASLELHEDLTFKTNITVLDGCVMWEYSLPLIVTSSGCSTSDVVAFGQQCGFTCQEGFRLIGNASTECQGNGQLSNSCPRCEEVNCIISNLPSHLTDKNKMCTNGSRVPYGTSCDFECTTGYSLTGNRTIVVTCNYEERGQLDYPKCVELSEESAGNHMGYVAFILIPFAMITSVLVWWYFRNRNVKKGEDYCIEHVNENINGSDRPLITNSEDFIELLREQVGKSSTAMMKVLHRMERAELRNVQKLSEMKISEHTSAHAKESVSDAFVCYVAEIYHCIITLDSEMEMELTNDIMSATDDRLSQFSKTTFSCDEEGLKESEGYFAVVNSALHYLICALRHSIEDTQFRREKTAKVFDEMKSYFDRRKEEMKFAEPKSSKSSYASSWSESNYSNALKKHHYFADLCLLNINKCATLEDGIRMRYKIVNIMLEPNTKTDECEDTHSE